MTEGSKRLIIYGYIKDDAKSKYEDTDEKRRVQVNTWEKDARGHDEEKKRIAHRRLGELEKDAMHDEIELAGGQIMILDYPKPLQKYYMTVENPQNSVEPYYYWLLHELGDLGFPYIDKLTDIFTAAEHSSFYGAAAQRLGLAQDKVGQYLATIGKMIKDMFQLVRELRWIDERKQYYEEADKNDSAMVALKGLWVDLVDGVVGGQRTGSNLFIMSQQLQFSTLPDLFFDVHPKTTGEIEKVVEEKAGEFNKAVKRVLKRKLYQFLTWSDSTYKELINRRTFTIRYLRQHYNVIKMYISWCKPYIRHIERLKGSTSRLTSPDVIAAFESSMVEIEVLGRRMPKGNDKVFSCILLTFEYRTKPAMQFQAEGYHRGPIHLGITNFTMRSYAWTKEDIEKYKKMKDEEDLEMLKSVDESLKQAMEALGDDLLKYLKEAEETIEIKDEKDAPLKKPEGLGDIFAETFKGFGEVFGSLVPRKRVKGKKISKKSLAAKAQKEKEEKDAATDEVKNLCFKLYDYFKKAHGMLAW